MAGGGCSHPCLVHPLSTSLFSGYNPTCRRSRALPAARFFILSFSSLEDGTEGRSLLQMQHFMTILRGEVLMNRHQAPEAEARSHWRSLEMVVLFCAWQALSYNLGFSLWLIHLWSEPQVSFSKKGGIG